RRRACAVRLRLELRRPLRNLEQRSRSAPDVLAVARDRGAHLLDQTLLFLRHGTPLRRARRHSWPHPRGSNERATRKSPRTRPGGRRRGLPSLCCHSRGAHTRKASRAIAPTAYATAAQPGCRTTIAARTVTASASTTMPTPTSQS